MLARETFKNKSDKPACLTGQKRRRMLLVQLVHGEVELGSLLPDDDGASEERRKGKSVLIYRILLPVEECCVYLVRDAVAHARTNDCKGRSGWTCRDKEFFCFVLLYYPNTAQTFPSAMAEIITCETSGNSFRYKQNNSHPSRVRSTYTRAAGRCPPGQGSATHAN